MKIKNDIILVLVILAVAFTSIVFINIKKNIKKKDSSEAVIISVNGKLKKEIDLSKDGDYSIEDDKGSYNIISIKDKSVRMKEANCPDKLCIHQGTISKNGEAIVCLPHSLVVEIKSKNKSDIDIVR